MATYDAESTIIIPEGAPLMPEFFPDLATMAEGEAVQVKPAPPWGTIALFVAGAFLFAKFTKMI